MRRRGGATTRALPTDTLFAPVVPAARTESAAAAASAEKVESAHSRLAVLRDVAVRAATAPSEWAVQVFDTLRGRLTARPAPRRGQPEVTARDAAHAEDLDLAQAALAGEAHAQREIYFGHIALVQHLLQTRRLASYRDDIAQDIFFRVFSRLHTYRGDSS